MKTSSIFVKSMLPTITILFLMIMVLVEFQSLQQNDVYNLKIAMEKQVNDQVDAQISTINIIANSVIGLYQNSQLIEDHEFAGFAQKILEGNQDITNLFVIEDDVILQSYPHIEYKGKNPKTSFSTYPVIIENQKNTLLEFQMRDNKIFVISIPFDFFLDSNLLRNSPLKLIMSNAESHSLLYQYNSESPIIVYVSDPNEEKQDSNVAFTDRELRNAIKINRQTGFIEFNNQKEYSLGYLIWAEGFEIKLSDVQLVITIFGVSFAT